MIKSYIKPARQFSGGSTAAAVAAASAAAASDALLRHVIMACDHASVCDIRKQQTSLMCVDAIRARIMQKTRSLSHVLGIAGRYRMAQMVTGSNVSGAKRSSLIFGNNPLAPIYISVVAIVSVCVSTRAGVHDPLICACVPVNNVLS